MCGLFSPPKGLISPTLLLVVLLTAFVIPSSSSQAESPNAKSKTLRDAVENLGLLYQEPTAPGIQEVWLLGRYHGQYIATRDAGQDLNRYETRRVRYGAQIKAFDHLTLHAQAVAGSDFNPTYNGFTELWSQWEFSPELKLTIGQQKHRFTHDRNVSSRYLNYLERGLLTNMFSADYTPAVTLQGTYEKLSYYSGVFSNRTSRNIDNSFTHLDSGYSILNAAYYDLGKALNTDTAFLHFSNVISDAKSNATNFNRFDVGLSSALILTSGSTSLVTELVSGFGGGKGSGNGISFQPSIFLTDALQLVGRYQFVFSNKDDGLKPQRRYEAPSGLESGELYNALYLGLDYYLAGHRLKIMHGIEYANMDGEGMWTFGSMIRFYFGPHSAGPFPMNQMLKGDLWPTD